MDEWIKGGETLRRIPESALSGVLIFTDNRNKSKIRCMTLGNKKNTAGVPIENAIRDFVLTEGLKINKETKGLKIKESNRFGSFLEPESNDTIFLGLFEKKYIGRLSSHSKKTLYYHAAISPDGAKLAFIKPIKGSRSGKLCILKLDDSEILNILNDVSIYSDVSWSPDSKKLYYVNIDEALFVYNLKSKTAHKIINGSFLVWSIDGDEFIYGTRNEMKICDSSGNIKNTVKVTNSFNAVFSPDKKFIAYVRIFVTMPLDFTSLEISNRNGSAKRIIAGMNTELNSNFILWEKELNYGNNK
ncbi:MAG: hypothetical protein V2A78_13135 [bacterium]